MPLPVAQIEAHPHRGEHVARHDEAVADHRRYIGHEELRRGDEAGFERERNKHLAFGGGPHRCLGSHLARMELEVALKVWHERIPSYRIKPGETPRYSPGIREVQYLPLVWDRA